MFAYKTKSALAASAFALAAFSLSVPASAQQKPVSGGTSGGVTGRDVSASTSGSGTTDGKSIGVGGTADATAGDGGTASTSVNARVNDRRGMSRSTAMARDEDERARSRTKTVVRQGEVVRSRTMSVYKERGEPPVREVVRSNTKADKKKGD